jgi:hypothetical protein
MRHPLDISAQEPSLPDAGATASGRLSSRVPAAELVADVSKDYGWSDEQFEDIVKGLTPPRIQKSIQAAQEEKREGLSDAFDGRMVHPSLDDVDDIITLGFRFRTKSLKEERVFFIETDGAVRIINGDSFTVRDRLYCYDSKAAHLASLEERWGVKDAKAFAESNLVSPDSPKFPRGNLIERVVTLVQRHVQFEDERDAYILAAWIIGTYFHRGFHAYPFLHVKAPKGSGKSQCLTLLAHLCFNATKARPSLAALGDTVDALRGTYLIDQADSLGRKGSEELLDILADSYKKSGGKRRIVNIDKGKRQVLEIETYAPKAFASIKELPEDLRDRCFVLPLIRSNKSFSDPDDPSNDWRTWRGDLYKAFLMGHSYVGIEYRMRRSEYRLSSEIVGRNLELWLPIETILACFGAEEKIGDTKRRFFSQYEFAEYEPTDLESEVVRVLLKRTEGSVSVELSPADIASDIDHGFFRGDSSDKQRAVAVGWAIKKFNVATKKIRRGSGVFYLFDRATVESVHASYFGNDLTSPTSPDSDTPVEPTNDLHDADVGDFSF